MESSQKQENNLGCGNKFVFHTLNGFICGVPDGNGKETFCQDCMRKLRWKWQIEDREFAMKNGFYPNQGVAKNEI